MKLKHLSNILVILIVLFLSVRIDAQIINGADLLFSENLNLIKGKSVAVVCNHSSLLSNGTHLVDSLLSLKDVKVIVTFTPEHGFKGDEEAGKNIDYKNDLYKEVPIVSLYGKDKKPSNEILKDVDVLIFDIQDVGARFYTYISTLYFVIEAAGENNIPIIILDRPNPIGGNYVDGPILDPNLKSFVGIAQLPITYGMTVGELANYFIGEKIIATSKKISLEVIKIKNWNREIPT